MTLRVILALSLPAALSIGCAPDETDDKGDAPPINTGEDSAVVECDGTAPVLTDLVVEGMIYPFEVEAPALVVSATATDADSDLHRMDVRVWWDDVVDGVVDTSGEGTAAGYYTFDSDPCATAQATYGLAFEVDGTRFDYATAYEFAAEVYDDAGLVSGQLVAHGVSPEAL